MASRAEIAALKREREIAAQALNKGVEETPFASPLLSLGLVPTVAALDESGTPILPAPTEKPRPRRTRRKRESNSDDPPDVADDYMVQTSQEVDALMRAGSDGKGGRFWHRDEGALTVSHETPDMPHRVQLELSETERTAGASLETLENLRLAQDGDFNLCLLYISRLLAPPSPLPRKAYAGGTIDLDDVMNKIGWKPRSTKERMGMRERVWRYILFGTRARIIGARSGSYTDPDTGAKIETIIESPPWQVMEKERPAQPSLFPEIGEAPLRVGLVASREWTKLTTLPETAQYLPMGELLGAIPGAKPSGAWARVVGLALASFWRRHPHEALSGKMQPTREEVLERYTPATGNVGDVLAGNDPRRAIEYWHGALQILADCEFLAREGEATLTYETMRERVGRQGWQEKWLADYADLRPGPQMRGALGGLAAALPEPKPRDFKRKRGRPRKTQG